MKYKKFFEIKFLMSYLDCSKAEEAAAEGKIICDSQGVPIEEEIPLPNYFSEAEKNVQLRLKFKLINTQDVPIRLKALI